MNRPKPKLYKTLVKCAGILLLLLSSSGFLFGQVAPKECTQKKLLEFKNYPATAYNRKPHVPVIATPFDHKYRTIIRDSIKSGANFAGHYALARWGCGVGCHQFVIVDLKTGIVFDPSFDEVDFHYGPKYYDPGWWCYSDLISYQQDSRVRVILGVLPLGSITSERCTRFILFGFCPLKNRIEYPF